MAKGIHIGAGAVKKTKEIYLGVGSVKKAKEAYIGVGGAIKKIWPSYIDLRDVFNDPSNANYIVYTYKDWYDSGGESYYHRPHILTYYNLAKDTISVSGSIIKDSTWGAWSEGTNMRAYLKYSRDNEIPANIVNSLNEYRTYELHGKEIPSGVDKIHKGKVIEMEGIKINNGGGLNNSGYWLRITLDRDPLCRMQKLILLP